MSKAPQTCLVSRRFGISFLFVISTFIPLLLLTLGNNLKAAVIDSFSSGQTLFLLSDLDDVQTFSAAADSSILGGERDIVMAITDGPQNRIMTSGVSGGSFTVAQATGLLGFVQIQWDGLDNSSNIDSFSGLGGANLTLGGIDAFVLNDVFNDLPVTLTLAIWSGGSSSSLSRIFPASVSDPIDSSFLFTEFTGSADFTSVNAITLRIDATSNLDLSIDSLETIGTVPEPGLIGLIGMVPVVFLLLKNRRRR